MSVSDLPTVNAILNLISAAFLTFGYVNVRKGRQETHKKFMLAALVTSALFLTSYLIYHAQVGSVKYPYTDWTRPVYFAILIPHIILAAVMTPFILVMVWHALRDKFEKHKRIARWIWPVWMFVSLSGVTVYYMLYLQ
jgi:uncharacterized membrane protein YozB (DUF420 family)